MVHSKVLYLFLTCIIGCSAHNKNYMNLAFNVSFVEWNTALINHAEVHLTVRFSFAMCDGNKAVTCTEYSHPVSVSGKLHGDRYNYKENSDLVSFHFAIINHAVERQWASLSALLPKISGMTDLRMKINYTLEGSDAHQSSKVDDVQEFDLGSDLLSTEEIVSAHVHGDSKQIGLVLLFNLTCEKNFYGCNCERYCVPSEKKFCTKAGVPSCAADSYPKTKSMLTMCQLLHGSESIGDICDRTCTSAEARANNARCNACGLFTCQQGYVRSDAKETGPEACRKVDCNYLQSERLNSERCLNGGRCHIWEDESPYESTQAFFYCTCNRTDSYEYYGPFCEELRYVDNAKTHSPVENEGGNN